MTLLHSLYNFLRTPDFIFKQWLQRRKDSSFHPSYLSNLDSISKDRLALLAKYGIVRLDDFFSEEQVELIRKDFELTIEGMGCKYNANALYNTDMFHLSKFYADVALTKEFLAIIGGYFSRPFGLARASASRIFPINSPPYGSFQWHHDARGRQVHLMVLLNDVKKDGQRMQYLMGTHKKYYSRGRGISHGSRFHEDVERDKIKNQGVFDLYGNAGTAFIFDANGLHRGNRNNSEARDVLIFAYATRRHFKKLKYKLSFLDNRDKDMKGVITFNPYSEAID